MLHEMGVEIKRRHPEHAADADAVLNELGRLHAELEREARARIEAAEQSQGRQLFERTSVQLLDWCETTKRAMLEEPVGRLHTTLSIALSGASFRRRAGRRSRQAARRPTRQDRRSPIRVYIRCRTRRVTAS